MQTATGRPLALVTGASSGIGYNLARIAAERGYDLVVAADRPLNDALLDFETLGANVTSLQVDLATSEGVDQLLALIQNKPLDIAIANAGHGRGGAFLEQEFAETRHVIDTNITGTIYLLQSILKIMKTQGQGRVLVTSSIAGALPSRRRAAPKNGRPW